MYTFSVLTSGLEKNLLEIAHFSTYGGISFSWTLETSLSAEFYPQKILNNYTPFLI